MFNRKGIFGGPSLIDKLDMLFTDAETEGKKQGYLKAANEYENAFRAIETEYKKTKELIASQKNTYDKQSDALIQKLEALEYQKCNLEKQVRKKTKAVSEKYDIPVSKIQRSLAEGTLISNNPTINVLDMVYQYKERKFREAEQRGYLEAKELYEDKIEKLKKDLVSLKNKGDNELKKLIDMMSKILVEIAEEQMKIAELKVLL